MKINIIYTTTDSVKTARNISDYLVKNNLSPCVQIVSNVESKYIWKSKLIIAKELFLIIKTSPKHVKECKKHIIKLHNYDTPEIIIIEGKILLDKYKEWFLDHIS